MSNRYKLVGRCALRDFSSVDGTDDWMSMLRNTTIKELNLAANDLNETTASYFAHVLGHNKSLTHLDLSNNQLGSVSIQSCS
ncbi:hypothetical protein AHF37_07556 [Paragonimus kellicotti]|nr:hypothetical protein AHF37_07556 [Paragonimus kellicotti]